MMVAFVSLNSTEIAILGGMDKRDRISKDIIVFNTSTSLFKKEVVAGTHSFRFDLNQAAKICDNTIVALTDNDNGTRLV